MKRVGCVIAAACFPTMSVEGEVTVMARYGTLERPPPPVSVRPLTRKGWRTMGALDGRVAIITGAGRGIGREHALLFAHEGAKVVVNDLGGAADGTGGDVTPGAEVVNEIVAAGGEAVANGDSVSSWEGAQRLVNAAIEAFGDLDILVNNAGILRDRVRRQHDRGGVGRGRRRPPEGPLRPHPLGRGVLARAAQGRGEQAAQPRAHLVDVRACSRTRARPTTARPSRASPP